MRTINSITHLLIGKNLSRTGSVQVLDSSLATFLASGEVVVCDVNGTVLNSTTVLTRDRIVIRQGQGTGGAPQVISPVIYKNAVLDYRGANFKAATAQVDYIGYNAATGLGAWDVINNNSYIIGIKNSDSVNYGTLGVEKFGKYTSDSSATHLEINDALAISLYENTTRTSFEPLFLVERVSSNAGAATTGATGTLTVVKGINTVTASVSATAEFAAGDYVRFGTAVTSPVYKVVSASGTTLTLDMPYQGNSGTFTAGNAEYITAALALAAASGIKLTGIDQTFNTVARKQYMVSRWTTTLVNGGTTPIVIQTRATEGIGEYEQIAQLEYETIGYEGFLNRNAIPYQTPRSNALSTASYSTLHLYYSDHPGEGVIARSNQPKELIIAFAVATVASPNTYGTNAQGAVTSVVDVLNAWLSTFPAVTLA